MHTDPRRAPDLDGEATTALDDDVRARLVGALRDRYGDTLDVDGSTGSRAAWLVCTLPASRTVHEVTVFARANDGGSALDRVTDYLDGVLHEMHARTTARTPEHGYFLPLDFQGRPFAGGVVFVRGEVRDYAAEALAAQLLGEALPLRRVRSRA